MVNSINSNSSYGASMMVQMRQNMFSSIDQNGDGSLDKSELQTTSGKSSSKIDDFISKLDTNNDSAISQQEFEAGLAKLHQEMKSEMNGMGGGAPPPPPSGGESSDSEFDPLDTNKDGYVSLEELTSGGVPDADQLFSKIDSDGDGKISKSESDAFREKMGKNSPEGTDQTTGVENLQSMQTDLLSRLIDKITAGTDSSQTSNSFYA